jgi:hypothetical protein
MEKGGEKEDPFGFEGSKFLKFSGREKHDEE